MKDLRQNSTEPARIEPITHLLNTDNDMIVSLLTLMDGKI